MWELDYKESWVLKNWCFWTVVLEKTLESPLDFKEIKPVHPKGNQSWIFIGRTDAEGETPILWLSDAKSWLIGKDPDAGKDWRQEGKGSTENEMTGCHHLLNGHEFEQALRDDEEQGSLVCCSLWVTKNWTQFSEWTNTTRDNFRSLWIFDFLKMRLNYRYSFLKLESWPHFLVNAVLLIEVFLPVTLASIDFLFIMVYICVCVCVHPVRILDMYRVWPTATFLKFYDIRVWLNQFLVKREILWVIGACHQHTWDSSVGCW